MLVDGAEVGHFSPVPNRTDTLVDGSVLRFSGIHFDEVRTTVLAMINGQSAVVLTADGSEIHLGRSELEEMQKVLSAYLHLQT